MSVQSLYRQLAYDTFQPQWITNVEDDERMLNICMEEIEKAGFPITLDEDVWMEYVYAAQEMVAIQQNGFVYRRVRNADRSGWNLVLFTRDNHPGFLGTSHAE